MRYRRIILILLIALLVILSGCTARLNRVIPKATAPGSVITLKGFWFGEEPGAADVYFGETKAVITLWGKHEISVKVPEGTGITDIFVEKDGKKSKGSTFTFLEEEYETLGKIDIAESDTELEVDGAKVTVPPGIVTTGEELKISEVTNTPNLDEELYFESRVYNVEIGDYSSFDDFLMLEFDIEKGMKDSEYITAAYWDESDAEWKQAPSYYDSEEGKVRVYTDHLTNWRLFALKKIYSVYEADHFLIAYNKRDKTDIPDQAKTGTMAKLAKRIGTALDDSYLKYSSVIGVNNSPFYDLTEIQLSTDKKIVDTRLIVRVSSSYNKFGAEYSWTTGQLIIPTKYNDDKDLKTTVAHELFHIFQNHRLSILQMNNARWFMEATAEYASYYVGTNYGIKNLHTYTNMNKYLEFFENREEGHEYGMSAYIDYLMNHGASFRTMWDALVGGKSSVEDSFDSYVRTATGKSNHANYRIFWQKVLTDSERPKFNITNIGVRVKSVRKGKTLKTILDIKRDWTMAAILTKPKAFNSDGSRTLIIEADGKMSPSARVEVFRVDGFDKKTFTHDRVPGGTSSFGIITDSSSYIAVEFTEGMEQVIYITAFSGEKEKINIKISDITLKLKPDKLEDVQPLKLYKFQAIAGNIPTSISDVTVSWHLDDGTFIEKEDHTNRNGRISDKITYEFDAGNMQDIVVTFEDSSSGKKITSGRIKVSDTQVLSVSYDPLKPMVNAEVKFSTKGDGGWYYKWDTDAKGQVSGLGMTETTDKYSQPGRYQIQVTAYEDSAMTKSVGYGTVVVQVEGIDVSQEPDPTVEPTEEPTVTPTDRTRWLAFEKEGYLPGEQLYYDIKTNSGYATSYESINYYKWSAKPADEQTLAAYKAAKGKDILYENKSGRPGSLAPEVPGTYEVTGVYVQDTDKTVSGQFTVKDGTEGYWQRNLYEFKENQQFDDITEAFSDSRIKTHTIGETTAYSYNTTSTTTYPDGTSSTQTYELVWDDLPEILRPGEIITLPYSSYYEGDENHYPIKSGLAVFYNEKGNEKGIISSSSYAGGKDGSEMVTVQFEVPAYGSIGNATKKLVLMSGMGLNTEDEAMFVPDNFTFAIKA
ncbi:MAG: hypothetical protein J7L77_08110, partial [Clostridiales bacterium]|nr:hypothetical protein [Clostridiales bacterium]